MQVHSLGDIPQLGSAMTPGENSLRWCKRPRAIKSEIRGIHKTGEEPLTKLITGFPRQILGVLCPRLLPLSIEAFG